MDIYKAIGTILLLSISNAFMTFAWYGHLVYKPSPLISSWGVPGLVIGSWLIALLEYAFMVPANRLGAVQTGGPFQLIELKTIQEVISLTVFCLITIFVFKTETLKWNHLLGFACLVLAVYFIFKK
jgi:uncharacterized protein (DUF486 family)